MVIFVDGCFWHGCPEPARIPKSRLNFWVPKLESNKARDRKITSELRRNGWRVIRIWEFALSPKRMAAALRRIRRALGRPRKTNIGQVPNLHS
jgi:DNA mismatch endonuclease, patch repair protein